MLFKTTKFLVIFIEFETLKECINKLKNFFNLKVSNHGQLGRVAII